MNPLTTTLQKWFPNNKALITSRGSTALALALNLIKQEKGVGEVIVPATVCPSVPVVVQLSGFTPRFCDVEIDSFCASVNTVKPHLNSQTKAMIAVYLFGKSFEIDEIASLCHSQQISLIEDIAQAIGGSYHNKALGSFGNFAITSFDETKIIKGKGGALLVKKADYADLANSLYQNLPPILDAENYRQLDTKFDQTIKSIYEKLRLSGIEKADADFTQQIENFRNLFVYQRSLTDDELKNIAGQVANLKAIQKNRFENYKLYDQLLKPSLTRVHFNQHEMIWRLPLLAPDQSSQNKIVSDLRSAGFLASNHYFPSSYLFDSNRLENARQIGLRAVNVWVDSKVTPESVRKICALLNSYWK